MRLALLLPLALAALLPGCTNAPAAATAAAAPASPTILGESGEALQKGMSPAEVRRIMGTPAEIQTHPSPLGKVEIWIYHRRIAGPTQQRQVGTRAITRLVPGSDGTGRAQTLDQVPIFQAMHLETTETIRLLVYNDRFIDGRIAAGRRLIFE